MKIDFHIHTCYSKDSITDLKKLAKMCKKLDIIPAITDHNTIKGAIKFKEYNIPYIVGEEIKTNKGDLIGLFINEPIKKGIDFEEALDIIKSQGGLTYLPHMYDLKRKGCAKSIKSIKKIDIIEVLNGRVIEKQINKMAFDFAKKNTLPMAAGSDSHFLFEFGKVWTEIEETDLEPKSILNSLKKSKIIELKRIHPIVPRNLTPIVIAMKKLIF